MMKLALLTIGVALGFAGWAGAQSQQQASLAARCDALNATMQAGLRKPNPTPDDVDATITASNAWRACNDDLRRLSDAQIDREDRAIRAQEEAGRSLQAAGDALAGGADAYGDAAQSIQPPPMPEPSAPVIFDPGYSKKPPLTVLCVGQATVSGPPGQAAACAGPR